MNRRQLVLGGLGFLGAACVQPKVRYPLPQQVTVYVVISDRVARTDTGNVSAMVEAIEADLREAGHFVNIVAARNDEAAPVPRLELQVRTSDPADTEAMASAQLVSMATPLAVVALAAAGSMDVDAFIVSNAQSPATYVGRVQTTSTFGATLGQDETTLAGERAGHGITSKLWGVGRLVRGRYGRRIRQPLGFVQEAFGVVFGGLHSTLVVDQR